MKKILNVNYIVAVKFFLSFFFKQSLQAFILNSPDSAPILTADGPEEGHLVENAALCAVCPLLWFNFDSAAILLLIVVNLK